MNEVMADRLPVVSGKFYSSDPERLKQDLNDLFAKAMHRQCQHVKSIIAPHAGYLYSGHIAATAYNQLNPKAGFKRIFILASSHFDSFSGVAVYHRGNFSMPYGVEEVDCVLGRKLCAAYPDLFFDLPEPHMKEHAIEVQLPFIHHTQTSGYVIVPLLIGTDSPADCKQIATALTPFLDDESLLIVSTDFCHYPESSVAHDLDQDSMRAIIENNPDAFLQTLANHKFKNIKGLTSSVCGWTAVLTLLYITTGDQTYRYHPIEYTNSGKLNSIGDKNHVVGYWAIALTRHFADSFCFGLSARDKQDLLTIARKTLENCCRQEKGFNLDLNDYSNTLKTECGAFVTLTKNAELRGSMGRLTANVPLYKMIHEMTTAAALHDPRFQPVCNETPESLDIEIAVLSPLIKIESVNQIIPGTHGIYLSKAYHSGIMLPHEAIEKRWSRIQMLKHCAHDKAGLHWDDWKKADIYIFTSTGFSE